MLKRGLPFFFSGPFIDGFITYRLRKKIVDTLVARAPLDRARYKKSLYREEKNFLVFFTRLFLKKKKRIDCGCNLTGLAVVLETSKKNFKELI